MHAIPADLTALTGIRFIAAFWVVLFHFRDEIQRIVPKTAWLSSLLDHGHQAVPFFFMLSGFILSHSYFPRYRAQSHLQFIFLRFARLWPVHFATILFLVAYKSAFALVRGHTVSETSYRLSALPAELGMVRCWYEKDLLWNFPAWSIHLEWFAYLFLFPITVWLIRPATRLRYLIAVAVALIACQHWLPLASFPGKCADIVFLFLLGSVLYRIRTFLSLRAGAPLAYVGLALVCGYIFLTASALFLYLGFALLLVGLSFNESRISRLLSWKPIVYGGTISYSLYMTHEVVHKVASEGIKRLPMGTLLVDSIAIFATLLGTIAIASVTYHAVEAPGNRILRSRLSHKRPEGNGPAQTI